MGADCAAVSWWLMREPVAGHDALETPGVWWLQTLEGVSAAELECLEIRPGSSSVGMLGSSVQNVIMSG